MTEQQPLREFLSNKMHSRDVKTKYQSLDTIVYNLQAELKVSADASSYGLGSVLFQKEKTLWKPVAYASRSLTGTEMRYAQIEKEALAVTWACEKFSDYLLGKSFSIETDHKPLIPLLNSKQLDNLPPRVLRFRLRLARYDYEVEHVPGKYLYSADTLSRAPLQDNGDTSFQERGRNICK